MSLTVQNDTGTQAGANAYISLAEFKSYHDDRGNVYSDDDAVLSAAIIKATDYIDQRFVFRGVKLAAPAQTTQNPRKAGKYTDHLLRDHDGEDIVGIAPLLKNATAEYALRASEGPLFQDAPAPEGGRIINQLLQKVDVIETNTTYAPSTGAGDYVIPAYPAADQMIARSGLIVSSRRLVR